MERMTIEKMIELEANSRQRESSIQQQSMDIDSPASPSSTAASLSAVVASAAAVSASPAVTVPSVLYRQQQQQQHTCNGNSSVLSVSPISNISNSSSGSSSTIEFLTNNDTLAAPKKCTCPYERPTLKTMEAAASLSAAANIASTNKLHYQQQQGGPPSQSLSVLFGLSSEDEQNANVLRRRSSSSSDSAQEELQKTDNINNNSHNSRSSVSKLVACDSVKSRESDSTSSIIRMNVNSDSYNNNSKNNNSNRDGTAEVNVRGASDPTSTTAVIVDPLKSSKSKVTTIKKGSSSNSNITSSCNCAEVKVKASEQKSMSMTKRITSPGKISSGDGILSNCLSALNFVSGNRIGIGSNSDSKSSGSNSNSGGWSPRGSKGGKSSTTSNDCVADSTNQQQLCGENCSKKGSVTVTSPAESSPATPAASGKSAKLCKSCRGHGMTTTTKGGPGNASNSSSSDITATGDSSKDKDGHVANTGSSKPKRSNWTLRFNCARLKGSKASSSSSSATVPKESSCKCSTESGRTTKAVVDSSAKQQQQQQKKNKKNKTTTTSTDGEPRTEVIRGSSVASSCSRVTTAVVGTSGSSNSGSNKSATSPSSSSSSVNCVIGNESNLAAMTNVTSGGNNNSTDTTSNQDCSRLSFIELATEDCDEWARMQREKEIEDGVEAPPGYLPKFQFNKGQSAAGPTTGTTNNNMTTIAASQPSLAGTVGSQPQQQQLTHNTSSSSIANSPMGNGQNRTQQWPTSAASPNVQLPQGRDPMAVFPHVVYEQKIHSQVDFIHCLVPDLQKITSCGFYWGKMDRYQAETLLDGKPEGTFLLRDSAQEEFLFSVSFRKYGRSLHARIEQFNHKFSFDSHDPGVYTANTVTGLLEHYKDPSCVMFFEPMLTQPLNRNFCFSLQQLCRATIVSETTYDRIGEMKLPHVMKGYLKEYHYKQKVRVNFLEEVGWVNKSLVE